MTSNKSLNYVPKIQTYEVRYLENKQSGLSPAARQKIIDCSGSNYVSKNQAGYGPCKNTLCGCGCSSEICTCLTAEASLYKEDRFSLNNHSVSGKPSSNKLSVSGQYSRSTLRINDESSDTKFLSGTVGGKLDMGGLGVKLNADLINVKSEGVQARAGLTFDTGITVSEGVKEFKLAGFGASIDENQIGISTMFGEIKFNYR